MGGWVGGWVGAVRRGGRAGGRACRQAGGQYLRNLAVLQQLAALLKIAMCKGFHAHTLDSSWQVAALRALSPQQVDGYNCGQVVLLVIRHMLSGAKLPSHRLTEAVMDTYRNVLTAELLQGSLMSS